MKPLSGMHRLFLGAALLGLVLIAGATATRSLATAASEPPDTAQIEALQSAGGAPAGISASGGVPQIPGDQAAVLAAELLLSPIDYFINLPMALR